MGKILVFLFMTLCLGMANPSSYRTIQEDFFDARYLRIDEAGHLGKRIEDITLLLPEGKRRLSSFLGSKPLVLIPAYYTCNGSCPVLLSKLTDKLSELKDDFTVLVLSFDRKDTLQTLKSFADKLRQAKVSRWKFALIDPKDIESFSRSTGFRFFYSERDKSFIHPTTMIFVSPDGIITRYLYGVNPSITDLKLALLDAKREHIKPSEIVDMALLMCYTYDPSRSKYVINPLLMFGGLGFALVGVVGAIVFSYGKTNKGGV